MSITVREALHLPAFRDAILVAGAGGLDRTITSVNVMEVPEIWRWAKPNELLVSTTYPIKDDPAAQATLVQELANRGLAALAIKPVLYDNRVPEAMIIQADERSFPLIQLPTAAAFDDIINPVLAEILNRQAAILRRSDEIHRSLTDIVLRGGGLNEIAHAVSAALDASVSIHDDDAALLACSSAADADAGSAAIRTPATSDRPLVHPVTVAQEVYAYLVIRPAADGRLPESTVVEQASTVIALEIAKLRAVAEVEQRFRSHLIQDLLRGSTESRAEVLARGQQYGWDLSSGFVPLLLRSAPGGGIVDLPTMTRRLRRLRQTALSHVQQHAPGSVVVDVGDQLLVLVRRAPADPTARYARRTVEGLASHLRATLTGDADVPAVSAGIGRPIDDILELREAYDETLQALEIGISAAGPGGTTSFDSLGTYRVLARGIGQPEQRRFCTDLLGKLLASDRRSAGSLVATLRVVLAANGNLRQAARDLFVHYNTLRYRVGRIERLTGTNLDHAEDRLNLQVALKILDVTPDLR